MFGLETPLEDETESPFAYDAISLFIQSANKMRPGFSPSDDEISQIVQICQIVQGMPLAIELAAAWLHILTVGEIVKELKRDLDILSTEVRDAPERHRSIRAVFDHSWSLLDQGDQNKLTFLSIFRSGFTREAAQQVSGISLATLSDLVNKSFLSHDATTGRFGIHELLRQYTQEHLEKSPKIYQSAQEAHAAYYADFMHTRWAHLKDNRQMGALDEIEADIENVRAAWRYYLKTKNTTKLWKFIFCLWLVYWIRWWNHAGMEIFGETVRVLKDENEGEFLAIKALAMAFQSYFMAWLDLADEGYKLAKQSVDLLESLPYPEALAFAYDSLGVNSYFLGRYAEEVKASEKMLEIAKNTGDKWLLAFTLFAISMGKLLLENYDEAKRIAEENLQLYEEIGDEIGASMPLIVIGHVDLARGEYEGAWKSYARCLEISQRLEFYYSIQTASKYLGKVAISMGKFPEAKEYLKQSLSITKEIGFVRDLINILFEYARLKEATGELEGAAELLSLVIGHPVSDQSRFGEGRIKDSAKALLSNIEKELPQDILQDAIERGRALVLETIIDELIEADSSL
jgi:tetratricopeptide (TPR) repeat protein